MHTFPTISLFLVYLTTERLVVKASHWKMLAPMTLVYGSMNFYETKMSGKPVYWFLTWEDWTTPLIVIAVFIFVVTIWLSLAKLTEWGKNNKSSIENTRSNHSNGK